MLGALMRLSRRARYALCGIFDLAYNGAGVPVRVKRVGERQGIPYRFLEQIFQDLRRAQLVSGKRGPGGGYVLTRAPEAISLRAVVEAVEGPLATADQADAEAWASSEHRPDFLWADVSERMAAALDNIAISDVCREAARRSIDRQFPDGLDYQI
jgi:Rrf2 family protein